MKETYNNNGYKGYELEIAGHPCGLFETPDGHCSIRVPMGETIAEREMFDNLVYYNQSVYHASSKDKVIAQVEDFIKNYKRKK